MTDVSVAGLTKTYPGREPVKALRGVDITIEAGTLVAVLGPSGCGKTTLLRTIAGFERPDAGTISFDGRVVASAELNVPPERRNVGIVPQEGALFPHLDVAGNIAFALRNRSRDERRLRVEELLDLVGLSGYEARRPHQLSGGQQQRVAIARALAPRPAVVLLDEPFTALDAALRTRLRVDVAEVLRRAEATAVLVTHDPSEALALADSVAVMRDGRIAQQGPSQEIYHRPLDLATALMLGDAVVLPADASGGRAHCALGSVPLASPTPPDGPVQVLLRPEQIVRDGESSLRAVVRSVDFRGHDAVIELDRDGVLVSARWSSVDVVAAGTTVGLAVVGQATVIVEDD